MVLVTPVVDDRTCPRKRTITRRVLWIAGGILLPIVVILTWRLIWVWNYRFAALDEGKLYRAAAMPPETLVKICQRHGIETVIDFRRPKEEEDTGEERVTQEREAIEGAGFRHVNIPCKQVPSPDVLSAFFRVMDDPANYPVLIHCTHGVGRAGVFGAIYRIEYNRWDNGAARREANCLGDFGSFRLSERKGKFLMEYVPRRISEPGDGGAASATAQPLSSGQDDDTPQRPSAALTSSHGLHPSK